MLCNEGPVKAHATEMIEKEKTSTIPIFDFLIMRRVIDRCAATAAYLLQMLVRLLHKA